VRHESLCQLLALEQGAQVLDLVEVEVHLAESHQWPEGLQVSELVVGEGEDLQARQAHEVHGAW